MIEKLYGNMYTLFLYDLRQVISSVTTVTFIIELYSLSSYKIHKSYEIFKQLVSACLNV